MRPIAINCMKRLLYLSHSDKGPNVSIQILNHPWISSLLDTLGKPYSLKGVPILECLSVAKEK